MFRPKIVSISGTATVGSAAGQTATSGPSAGTGGQTASAGGQINPTNAMVVTPEQPLPLSATPNSAFCSRAGALANAGVTYSTTVQATQSGNVIPDQVFDAPIHAQNRNAPHHLNFVNHTSAQQNLNWAEFTRFKEELASVIRNKLGVDFGNTRLYQKSYDATFDIVPFPNGWRMPDFIKFSGDDERTTWEHISQYIAQLAKKGNWSAIRVRLFSLSLTNTAFAWFSSLAPDSIEN